jgi:hypothetical protein
MNKLIDGKEEKIRLEDKEDDDLSKYGPQTRRGCPYNYSGHPVSKGFG